MSATAIDSLIQPLITERVKELVRERLTTRGNFFHGHDLAVSAKAGEIKIALLLVRKINPFEHLSQAEEALLRGVSRNTLRAMLSKTP